MTFVPFSLVFFWCYDENRIFPIKAILKLNNVVCIRRKMLFTIFKYLFSFQRLANYPIDDVIHSAKFWSNMMKKDISASLYQKCLVLCTKILLNVLHNTNSTVLLPWQNTGFQASPILKVFSGHLWHSILIFANSASYVWSSKHINLLPRVCGTT